MSLGERGLYRILVRRQGRRFHAHVVIPGTEESRGLNSNPWELEFVGESYCGWYARKPERAAAKAVRALGAASERIEIRYAVSGAA